jgi:hypothetical protein
LAVFSALGAQLLMEPGHEPSSLIQSILLLLVALTYCAVVWLLLHADSAPWFNKRAEEQPNTSCMDSSGK